MPETYLLEDFLVVAKVLEDDAIRVPADRPVRFLLPERLQGYLAHKKTPTPYDHHRALGMTLL